MHALRVQLHVSLSPDSFANGSSDQQAHQMHPFGVPMVEELLPDSFLKHSLGSFFQMLQVRRSGDGNGGEARAYLSMHCEKWMKCCCSSFFQMLR